MSLPSVCAAINDAFKCIEYQCHLCVLLINDHAKYSIDQRNDISVKTLKYIKKRKSHVVCKLKQVTTLSGLLKSL